MWFSFAWALAIIGGLFAAGLASGFLGSGIGASGPPTQAPGPLIGMMGLPVLAVAVAALSVVHYFRRKS